MIKKLGLFNFIIIFFIDIVDMFLIFFTLNFFDIVDVVWYFCRHSASWSPCLKDLATMNEGAPRFLACFLAMARNPVNNLIETLAGRRVGSIWQEQLRQDPSLNADQPFLVLNMRVCATNFNLCFDWAWAENVVYYSSFYYIILLIYREQHLPSGYLGPLRIKASMIKN